MHENNFIYTRNFLRRPCKPSYYLCEFLLKFKCQETAQLFQVFKSLWAKTWDPKLIQCVAQKPLPLKIVHYTFTKKLFMFNNSFSELFANPKNYPECMNQKKYLQKRTYLLIVDLSIQKNWNLKLLFFKNRKIFYPLNCKVCYLHFLRPWNVLKINTSLQTNKIGVYQLH